MALRALIAVQLAALVALGAVTVLRFPVWALVDERAHYDYVQTVAEEGRLPDLRDELISPEAEAIDEGVFPAPPRTDPAARGLAGRSYEAFQPPLYYVVAAGPFAAGGDHLAKVRVLRLLGLACLLLAAFLLWRLARGSPAVFAVALCFLLWPGVVVRTVTVSNAALELPLALGAMLAARAAHERRDGRLLVLAGALAGLGLLTRLSLVVLLPVLAVVALLHVRRGGRRATAALALALPCLLLAPWVASNVERYGAPTASALVREMQDPVLNPSGRDLGTGDLPDLHERLLGGVIAEEWWSELLSPAKRRLRDVFLLLTLALPLGLVLVRRPPAWALLCAPLALGIGLMSAGLLLGNWDFFYPRYLYGVLPAAGVAIGAALGRVALPYAATVTFSLLVLWAHLGTVTPFTP